MGDKGLNYFGNGIGDDSDFTSYKPGGCEWTGTSKTNPLPAIKPYLINTSLDCGTTTCGLGQNLLETVRCPDGDGKVRRALCCAIDGTPDPDYCTWRGYRTYRTSCFLPSTLAFCNNRPMQILSRKLGTILHDVLTCLNAHTQWKFSGFSMYFVKMGTPAGITRSESLPVTTTRMGGGTTGLV